MPFRHLVNRFPPLVLTIAFFLFAVPDARGTEDASSSDLKTLSLFKKTVNPEYAISFFDNEDHTPDRGKARSSLRIRKDPLAPKNMIMEMYYTLPPTGSHYAGWFLAKNNGYTDLSQKTVLRFDLKGDPKIPTSSVVVGLRSTNINPNTNHAKIFLSDLGIKQFTSEFVHVDIPLKLLLQREPDLDLSQIKEVFILGVIGPPEELTEAVIVLRSITWDWGLAALKDDTLTADLSAQVLFAYNSHELKPAAKQYLNKLGKELKPHRSLQLVITGHTDNIGGEDFNSTLSKRRAESVADYLAKKGFFIRSQILTKGEAFRQPIANNATEAGRSKNRRVELLLKKD
ncbi:MAG: OmpA family protein [Elusimicrobia bacterium]|nr:OmpA family protein [Elusimicrobiota bacterium]